MEKPINQQQIEFKKAEYLTDVIAQLSAVDGAVIVTTKLQIVGFGAVIGYSQSKSSSYDYLDYDNRNNNMSGRTKSIKNKGTRHKSAYYFCKNNKAVAFVVSQDGEITCIAYCEKVSNQFKVAVQKKLCSIIVGLRKEGNSSFLIIYPHFFFDLSVEALACLYD